MYFKRATFCYPSYPIWTIDLHKKRFPTQKQDQISWMSVNLSKNTAQHCLQIFYPQQPTIMFFRSWGHILHQFGIFLYVATKLHVVFTAIQCIIVSQSWIWGHICLVNNVMTSILQFYWYLQPFAVFCGRANLRTCWAFTGVQWQLSVTIHHSEFQINQKVWALHHGPTVDLLFNAICWIFVSFDGGYRG